MKTALITGITGQDGAYLAQLLIEKGYKVIGLIRKNIAYEFQPLKFLGILERLVLEPINLENQSEILTCIEEHNPDEIYNLAAQSSVGKSFNSPFSTFHFNTLSVLNLLEVILKYNPKIKFYQASSSEMFGNVSLKKLPIKESLLFNPSSPYGTSKASAHWMTINYREAYGLFATCGILFNHESALRGDNFVIKKLIKSALLIKSGKADKLTLGNLAISRDWGYAPKYVEAMWLMLQQESPQDYIICSGHLITLQDVVLQVFDQLNLDLEKHLRLDKQFMRSLDLSTIYGDNTKAKNDLKWKYTLTPSELIAQLIEDEKDWQKWTSATDSIHV